MVKRAKHIASLYAELGVGPDKFLLRLPATWEGVRAAAALQAAGLPTHVVLVYSFVQAAAAAQAGAAVIQPNVAALADFYKAYPNVVRDPRGPREDAGCASAVNPGLPLVPRIWAFCRR